MTYQGDFTLPNELLEQIAAQGLYKLPELIRIVINAAMQAERQQYLGAAPYQHSPDRMGHANGFKPKTVKTRLGEIDFDIPQVREGGFYPQALEKGLRSERALNLAMAEMYVLTVSISWRSERIPSKNAINCSLKKTIGSIEGRPMSE
jgi:putative transposase